jgi:hypothetical protein
VQIDERNNRIVITADTTNPNDSDEAIEFFPLGGGNYIELEGDLKVVASDGIDCDNNNGNGNGNNNNNNNHPNNRQDRRNAIRNLIDQYRENSDLSSAEQDLAEAEGELSTLDNQQYEDTLGNNGVSANADENGASAETPGASASANGDEDTLGPVGPQGDVVDEVPTSGPLPNTGGVPVATGTVLALVFFGAGLLVVRLVMLWRGRRT